MQTLDQCGGIDILVSNAAVNPFFGNTLDSTEEVWDKVRSRTPALLLDQPVSSVSSFASLQILSVNVKSAFLLTKLVVPHMEKRG